MVTVAMLADAPTLTTGFGRTTRRMADSLIAAGHRPWCFGLKAGASDVDPDDPVRLWPAQPGEADSHWSVELRAFFARVPADVLLLNMDAYNALECVDTCRSSGWEGPIVSYVCFDGTPLAEAYLSAQRRCNAVWATSAAGAAYLRSVGIPVAGTAPPGVDLTEFSPPPQRRSLRARLGLADSFLIGVFATNTPRKRLTVALRGFAQAVAARPDAPLRMYFHCSSRGATDLAALAEKLGVLGKVRFANDSAFDEKRGVAEVSSNQTEAVASFDDLSYVERMGCCDMIVNVPHSGDIEQAVIEAQACGVPVAATDDGGIMAEALGGAGLPLPVENWVTGPQQQRLAMVAPAAVARAIIRLHDNPEERTRLARLGFRNAAQFPWLTLESATRDMVAPFIREMPGARSSR